MEPFGQHFENLKDDTGFQPEVISPELPPQQRFDHYARLSNAPKHQQVSDEYHAKLVEYYQKMADLARKEIEDGE